MSEETKEYVKEVIGLKDETVQKLLTYVETSGQFDQFEKDDIAVITTRQVDPNYVPSNPELQYRLPLGAFDTEATRTIRIGEKEVVRGEFSKKEFRMILEYVSPALNRIFERPIEEVVSNFDIKDILTKVITFAQNKVNRADLGVKIDELLAKLLSTKDVEITPEDLDECPLRQYIMAVKKVVEIQENFLADMSSIAPVELIQLMSILLGWLTNMKVVASDILTEISNTMLEESLKLRDQVKAKMSEKSEPSTQEDSDGGT